MESSVGNINSSRIEELDIAKGICILLMVIGHTRPTFATHFIYAFHMPFFFFVSGVTTNVGKPFPDFIKGKAEGLLLPFIIYYCIHIPCYAFLHSRGCWDQFILEAMTKISGALWLIPILFLSQMINWLIPLNKYVEMVAVISLASISSILCIEGIHLPWNLSVLGFGSSFIVLGRMMSVGGAKMLFSLDKKYLLFAGFVTALITYLISENYQLGMYFDRIEPCLPIMAGAITGIMMVLILSRIVSLSSSLLKKFFVYTGVNTFVFIGFSQFILKLENLYIQEYVIMKYIFLFFALYLIIYLKNRIPLAKELRL